VRAPFLPLAPVLLCGEEPAAPHRTINKAAQVKQLTPPHPMFLNTQQHTVASACKSSMNS